MRKASAGVCLTPNGENVTKNILSLTRRDDLEASIFKPGGPRTENRTLTRAQSFFKWLLLHGFIELDQFPAVYHQATQEEALTLIELCNPQNQLSVSTKLSISANIPPSNALLVVWKAKQLLQSPVMLQPDRQTLDSINEQKLWKNASM